MSTGWTRHIDCPICRGASGKKDCRISDKTGNYHCHHSEEYDAPPGWKYVGKDDKNFSMFCPPFSKFKADLAEIEKRLNRPGPNNPAGDKGKKPSALGGKNPSQFERICRERRDPTESELRGLEKHLTIPSPVFNLIGAQIWDDGQAGLNLVFPEKDGNGQLLGYGRRILNPAGKDEKKFSQGGKRGLVIPSGWRDIPGPLYLVEGPTDTMAMLAMGLCVIGRPSNMDGVDHLVQFIKANQLALADREIIVVGENDQKHNSLGAWQWAGREGGEFTSAGIFEGTGRRVMLAFPPAGDKDVRDMVIRHKEAMRAKTITMRALGEQFAAHVQAAKEDQSIPLWKKTAAEVSVTVQEILDKTGAVATSGPDPAPPPDPHPCSHDHDHRPPCQRPYGVKMLDKDTLRLRIIWVDCGLLGCEKCREVRRNQYQDTVSYHCRNFEVDNPGVPVFVFSTGPAAWESTRAALRRSRARYFRIAVDQFSSVILSTSAPPETLVDPTDVRQMVPQDAAVLFNRYIEHHADLKRGDFSHTRKSWPLLADKVAEQKKYMRIGNVPTSPDQVANVLETSGIDFLVRSHIGIYRSYVSWDLAAVPADKIQKLLHDIDLGEVLADLPEEVLFNSFVTPRGALSEPGGDEFEPPPKTKSFEDFMVW